VVLHQDAWELPADSDRAQLRVAFPEARRGADRQVDPGELEISVRSAELRAALGVVDQRQVQLGQLPRGVVQETVSAPDEALRVALLAADRKSALLQQERRAEREHPASEVVPKDPAWPVSLAWKLVPQPMAHR
jgi:hypothetical protein